MFPDYCVNREGDCYKMDDSIHDNIYYSHDIIWMKQIYSPALRPERPYLDWFDDNIIMQIMKHQITFISSP